MSKNGTYMDKYKKRVFVRCFGKLFLSTSFLILHRENHSGLNAAIVACSLLYHGLSSIDHRLLPLPLQNLMQIDILNTQHIDSPAIFALYDDAIAYQKKVGNNHWLGFQPSLIAKEIEEGRHYKVMAEGNIVSTFCITRSDPAIWKELNSTPAVYIHRIATSHTFRGHNVLKHIVNWALKFAKLNHLRYIRMDTGAGNDRLISYYISCGFTFIGNTVIDFTPGMPAHYEGGSFALLQMGVGD